MNKIWLSGNLGKDPERMKNTEKIGCSFSLATRAWNGETDWHQVKCWNKSAELCLEYLQKGSGVNIIGSVKYRKFTSASGEVVKCTDIVANEVEFLGRKSQAPSDRLSDSKDDYSEDLF